MKRFIFIFLTLLTLYLATMYHLLPFLVLFAAEVFYIICMWIFSHYLRRNFTVSLPEQCLVEERSTEYWCNYKVTNSGKMPVVRFRIRLRIHYVQEMTGVIKHLYGTAESGTSTLRFGIRAPYCGVVCLEFEGIQIFDYLGFFFGKNVLRQKVKVAILPPKQLMFIELPSFEWNGRMDGREKTVLRNGDAYNEIRQIHEYRAGDSYRHIHWNQSAKTDKIWIKEYETEADSCIHLLLEIDVFHWVNPKDMDAFYRLLYSMILGLLQRVHSVKVYWYDGHPNQLAEKEILDEAQCQDMFLLLYQMTIFEVSGQALKTLQDTYTFTHGDYFRLDSELCWYLNNTLIYRFSVETLEEEIAKKEFTL